ncbi:MAG: hypothetical protein AB7K24_28225, partial [Gemmataceae bacterium]
ELKMGDVLQASATLRYRGTQPTFMVMVDLGVPPGFQADASEFEAMVRDRKIAKFNITGRQIILYLADVQRGDTLTFDYTLRPRFPAKVQTPPSTAYEYNTPTERAVADPVELTVTPR